MSKLSRLMNNYLSYIAVPWRSDAAAAQRVVFCVYDAVDELKLRAKITEFEIATRQTGHNWMQYDLTDTFAEWLSSQRYAVSYYQKPHLLPTLLPRYLDYIVSHFSAFIDNNGPPDESAVVALCGGGSLFGLLKMKEVVDRLAPLVPGRLLIFFPGSYEDNNYRLLDGYDGWNYLAVPITADK